MRRLHVLLASLLITALACAGVDDGDTPTPEPAAEPAPEVTFVQGGDSVAAYRQSCSAVMTTVDDFTGEEKIAVCDWIAFDQMCAPDPSGCWDQQQDCKSACVPACGGCEAACATDCGSCKEQCGSDDACLQKCAEDRASCQDSCLEQRDTCMDSTCDAATTTCYREFDEKLARFCPKCDEIRHCAEQKMYSSEAKDDPPCEETFADEDPRCFDWCPPRP